ncbi:FimV/HubP family polar landmark protein [Ectothiorhodospira sp. BSL-9]|uniref:PFGI-1 class ICE element type IV pilus protein PilL2 n=1 Tax=Ectothiorhodospira sp. BSL-9 TaxID=1442136 RepID=UPI0007B53BAF|nr:FimV/HubP family polar landmark protein [Ectothiorhodospira sp. BSL-9]
MRQRFLTTLVVTTTLGATMAAASGDVRVGRYQTLAPIPTAEQVRPLSVIVDVRFPRRSVQTVGDAVRHLLPPSGFALADAAYADPYRPVLLNQPLPEVHRHLGPLPLEQALATLAGEAWQVSLDPVHRLVSFELRPEYQTRYVERYGDIPPMALREPPDRAETRDAPRWVEPPAPAPVGDYGPVRPQQTLLDIASELWPGHRARQGLVALWQANPEAFLRLGGEPNMNLLREGVWLRVPDSASVDAIPTTDAEAIIRAQFDRWRPAAESAQIDD